MSLEVLCICQRWAINFSKLLSGRCAKRDRQPKLQCSGARNSIVVQEKHNFVKLRSTGNWESSDNRCKIYVSSIDHIVSEISQLSNVGTVHITKYFKKYI